MSKKHFSWLLIVTAVVTALVLLIPGKTGRESSFEKHTLLPGLAAVVNELDYIRLTAGGGEIIATLQRSDGKWRVTEASSYPADWVRLKALLSDLSLAEVVEEKTSTPEFYDRLGVEDVATAAASGVMIAFSGEAGLPALIVGNQATGREGQFLRLHGEGKSVLLDRNLDVPRDRMQWLEREIIDISDGEVVEVTSMHPDGEVLRAGKASADDTDFELHDIPEGSEIKSNWTVNSIGGSLSALSMDEVLPDSEVNWAEAVVFTALTADGLQLRVELVSREESKWIRLGATVYQPDEENAGQENQRVIQINDRVRGWAYRIPQSKYDAMTRRMDDMIKVTETP